MENEQHRIYDYIDLKRANGYVQICCEQQSRAYLNIDQLPQTNETWVLHPGDEHYDFTNPVTGLKRSNTRYFENNLWAENSIPKFHNTYLLHDFTYNSNTCPFKSKNDIGGKTSRFYNLEQDTDPKIFKEIPQGSVHNSQSEMKLSGSFSDPNKFNKSEENEIPNILYGRKPSAKCSLSSNQKCILTKEASELNELKKQQESFKGYKICVSREEGIGCHHEKTKTELTKFYGNREICGENIEECITMRRKISLKPKTDVKDVVVRGNYDKTKNEGSKFSEAPKDNIPYVSKMCNRKNLVGNLSSITLRSHCSNDSFAKLNKEKNKLQVFYMHGHSKQDYKKPELCISDSHISRAKPDVNSMCTYYTSHPIRKMNFPLNTTTQNQKQKKTSCEQQSYTQTHACSKRDLEISKKRSCHYNESTSLSSFSLLFIIKDMNSGNCNFCKRTEGFELLSTTMICLRLNNHSEKEKRLSNTEKITRNDCAVSATKRKVPEPCRPTFCTNPSNRIDPCSIRNPKTLRNQEVHTEELKFLLSFQTDDSKNCCSKNSRYVASSTIQCPSVFELRNYKVDGTAQAIVSQKCACIQLPPTEVPTMHHKCYQICPSLTSVCVQPSFTIILRKSKPTIFPTETTFNRNKVCGAQTSTECSDLLPTPPPCSLFLPKFENVLCDRFIDRAQSKCKYNQEVASRLECTRKKQLCALSAPRRSFSLKSETISWLSGDAKISGGCAASRVPNSSTTNNTSNSSVKELCPLQPNIVSHTFKDCQQFHSYNGTSDSEEHLATLNLNKSSLYSKVSKKCKLLSTFDFRSTKDIIQREHIKDDLTLLTEDFQNLKKALEDFMTIDDPSEFLK